MLTLIVHHLLIESIYLLLMLFAFRRNVFFFFRGDFFFSLVRGFLGGFSLVPAGLGGPVCRPIMLPLFP
jgi:hypothetical protein